MQSVTACEGSISVRRDGLSLLGPSRGVLVRLAGRSWGAGLRSGHRNGFFFFLLLSSKRETAKPARLLWRATEREAGVTVKDLRLFSRRPEVAVRHNCGDNRKARERQVLWKCMSGVRVFSVTTDSLKWSGSTAARQERGGSPYFHFLPLSLFGKSLFFMACHDF